MVDGKETLSTTATSLNILEILADQGWITLRDLVEETGLAKSTVHKHLSTLRENDFVVKNGEYYTISLAHVALGKRAKDIRRPFDLVEQKIQEFGHRTDAELDFTVEENGQLILIFEVVGGTNESTFGIGSKFHLHNTAAGKVILAEYPDSRIESILNEQGMPKTTSKTIDSRESFMEEIEKIRDQGYAINDGEGIEGYRSVSSAIMNPDGSVLGAISAGGPIYRIEKPRLENELRDYACNLAEEITQELSEDYRIHP